MRKLSCNVRTAGALTILELAGDIDLAVGSQLWAALESVLTPGTNVVVDCSAVTFFDSTGLRVFLQALHHARSAEATLSLAALPEPVSSVLELGGVKDLFVIHGDPATAQVLG